MTKICSKCGEEIDIELFVKDENRCKLCRSIQDREYRQKNADKIRITEREYRQKNADKLKKINSKWHQKNADKVRERMREYRQKNADKLSEYFSIYNKKNACLIIARNFFYKNGLSIKNVPKELFELKALQLELMRETKKQRENEK